MTTRLNFVSVRVLNYFIAFRTVYWYAVTDRHVARTMPTGITSNDDRVPKLWGASTGGGAVGPLGLGNMSSFYEGHLY
jgi:hypothetical protein